MPKLANKDSSTQAFKKPFPQTCLLDFCQEKSYNHFKTKSINPETSISTMDATLKKM
jgi:hypothetical protein